VNLFGPLPSLQHNLLTLDADRRVLAYLPLEPQMLREVRLPYLDRNLLEFMYAIPREQIVRVGQRRSLMRRALVGIVPDELLNRKKKASVPPPVKGRSPNLPSWAEIGQYMISSSVGIMNSDRFLEALQKARRKEDVPIESLMRTLELECWMRQLAIRGVLASPMSTETQQRSPFCESEKLQGPVQPTRSAN
jgi:asparagine synthase (glutamine-hydrolysing)